MSDLDTIEQALAGRCECPEVHFVNRCAFCIAVDALARVRAALQVAYDNGYAACYRAQRPDPSPEISRLRALVDAKDEALRDERQRNLILIGLIPEVTTELMAEFMEQWKDGRVVALTPERLEAAISGGLARAVAKGIPDLAAARDSGDATPPIIVRPDPDLDNYPGLSEKQAEKRRRKDSAQ